MWHKKELRKKLESGMKCMWHKKETGKNPIVLTRYRSISLNRVMRKLTERLIENRLNHYLEKFIYTSDSMAVVVGNTELLLNQLLDLHWR
ncbi:hypothetical protein TNCT_306021 [Trichonephila clavata]|uniref:Reverse transcriptase n=1 Tax=Trichonephila clavata TaxID=2740835 RepID=A0A8X6K883_TRICU|nr:hypothetical protein TNCT_306021 [Trichonephila clavata]